MPGYAPRSYSRPGVVAVPRWLAELRNHFAIAISTNGRSVPYTNSNESRLVSLDDIMLPRGPMVAGAVTVVRVSFFVLAMLVTTAEARGVSPYLPVDISPEIERKIERVLILADQPSLKRPFAAATVQDALPRACEVDAALCAEVGRYLASLTRTAGITYATLTASESSGADTAVPTSHGMSSESNYNAAIAAYWQPSAAFLVTAGVLGYEGEATPTGTVASFGLDVLQVDVGYRDRWWSPAQGSAML